MKKLLTICFLYPVVLFAQDKSESFISKYHYLKFSPSMLLLADASDDLLPEKSLAPAMFGTVGAKITRYTAVGFCAGYFELNQAGPVTPLGVDLTITDFKAKKAFPVIFAQWFHADFTETYQRGGSISHSYNIKGKQMYNVGAGISLRTLKTKRIYITGSYSQLTSKTNIISSYYPEPSIYTTKNDHQNILMLSASLVL